MKKSYFVILLALLSGCACPTDLDDSGKVVKPTVYCKINFIHAAPDNRNLSVRTEFRSIIDDLAYDDQSYSNIETEASKTTLSIFEGTDELLYRNLMVLDEKHNYSCFV